MVHKMVKELKKIGAGGSYEVLQACSTIIIMGLRYAASTPMCHFFHTTIPQSIEYLSTSTLNISGDPALSTHETVPEIHHVQVLPL